MGYQKAFIYEDILKLSPEAAFCWLTEQLQAYAHGQISWIEASSVLLTSKTIAEKFKNAPNLAPISLPEPEIALDNVAVQPDGDDGDGEDGTDKRAKDNGDLPA